MPYHICCIQCDKICRRVNRPPAHPSFSTCACFHSADPDIQKQYALGQRVQMGLYVRNHDQRCTICNRNVNPGHHQEPVDALEDKRAKVNLVLGRACAIGAQMSAYFRTMDAPDVSELYFEGTGCLEARACHLAVAVARGGDSACLAWICLVPRASAVVLLNRRQLPL